jgi:hypothetical protein
MFGLSFGRGDKKGKKNLRRPRVVTPEAADGQEEAPVAPELPPKRRRGRPPGSKNRVLSYEERLDRERWRYLCKLRREDPERYRQILERGMGTAEATGDTRLATLAEAMRILKEFRAPRNVPTSERFETRNASRPGGVLDFGPLLDAFSPRPSSAPTTPASSGPHVSHPTPVPSADDCPL